MTVGRDGHLPETAFASNETGTSNSRDPLSLDPDVRRIRPDMKIDATRFGHALHSLESQCVEWEGAELIYDPVIELVPGADASS